MVDAADVESSFYSSKTQLRIGDYVVLKLSDPEEGWLSSPGLLDDNCFATTDPDHFENCIWEVHVQNQYSAAKEFKEALFESIKSVVTQEENIEVKKTSKSVKMEREHLNQLRRAALNEQRLNEKLMGLRKGKPVAFGDPIQLRHVKSQKFLTVSIDTLARDERENMRVYLNAEGDSLSCLGFMPRYRFDKEGHVLTNNSEVMIRVHERGGEYLHAAKVFSSDSGAGKTCEVNCSLESSYWSVILYQKVEDLKGSSITAGQLITLQDPDSLCCLTVDRNVGKGEKPKVIMSPQFQLRDLRPGSSTVGTNLLWFLEKSDITVGGPITIDADEVALRDLNSGLYMRLDDTGLTAVKSRYEASRFEFRSVISGKGNSSLYLQDESTVHLATMDLWLVSSKDGTVCEGSQQKGRAISLSISSALFKRLGVHLHVGVQAAFILKTLVKVAHDVEHRKVDSQELIKCLRLAYGVLDSLSTFLAYNDEQSNDDISDINITTDKDLLSFRQHMLREQGLIDVLLDLLNLTEGNVFDNIQNPVLTSDARATKRAPKKDTTIDTNFSADLDKPVNLSPVPQQVNQRRRASFQLLQNGIFGQRSLQTQADSGNNLVSTNNSSEKNSKSQEMKKHSFTLPAETARSFVRRISTALATNNAELILSDDSDDDNEEEDFYGVEAVKEHKSAGSHLAHRCLKVLLGTITNNPKNQLYVADRFPVILAQVQEHRLAVLCVEELLKENLSILQTKVRQREIDIFVELLAQYEMSVTFLRLLQSTCSCPMGVDATQRMVTHALFGYPNLLDAVNVLQLKVLPSNSGEQIRKSISIRFQARPKGPDRLKEELSTKQKLVIKIHADRNKLNPVEWRDFSLYCPKDPENLVIGYSELKNGVPELWLSWQMSGKEDEFSMHALFGYKDQVPLELVCSALRKNSITKLKNKNVGGVLSKTLRRKAQIYQKKQSSAGKNVIVSTGQNRTQVAEYFTTQLYLVADLCLDRNYVAMIILESMYPYDILVAMLKTENVSSGVRAAVCRIIRCLYVDREPQVEAKFPRLIRTSLVLTNRKEVADELFAPTQDQYKFALLQTIISQFIADKLDLNYSDELSAEMLNLLQSLVSFSFYRTVPQILDVLKPLVRILDEKRLQKETKETDSTGDDEFATKWNLFKMLMSSSDKQVVPFDSQHGTLDDSFAENWDSYAVQAAKFQKVLDSVPWQIFVLMVVIVSVALAIVQLFTAGLYLEFFIASVAFFAFDLVLRIGFYSLMHEKVTSFWHDIYNIVDTALVFLDIALLITVFLSASGDTASLRIIRLLRVVRLAKTFQMMKQITETNQQKQSWKIPKRYLSVKKYEAKTMISMLEILSMFYSRIQDKTLDVAIKAFAIWNKEAKRDQHCDPLVVFEKMMAEEERISSELSKTFDNVLLDTLMYSDIELTKAAVRLLMVHKSQRDLFFQVAEEIQIVYSPKVAGICHSLSVMIVELRRLGEMYEIWSDLESENDLEKAQRVQDILDHIYGFVGRKNEDRTLGIRSLVLVDEEVQNILRNLDAMDVFITLQNALYDGGREELKPKIREILKLSNEVICLFVKNSETNQTVAFQHIEWFIERVSDDIGSSKVLRYILEGNKDLIKKCPRNYLGDFAQKILNDGRKPEYLDIFVGMIENSNLFGSRVLSIEAEICSYLTSREWKKAILLWCGPKDSDEYFERRLEMERCTQAYDGMVLEDELSPSLRYHIKVLTILANCNLGPRIFALYPLADVLSGILDKVTIFPVKIELSRLLVCMLKISIDRAERSDSFWDLIDVIIHYFDALPNEFVALSKSPKERIQKGEWIGQCANIASAFFEKFEVDAFSVEVKVERSGKYSAVDPRITMQKLYKSIRNLVDYHAGKLGSALTNELIYASNMINRQLDIDSQYGGEQDIGEQQSDLAGNKLQTLRAQHQRASVVYADVQQDLYRKQFSTFLSLLKTESKNSKEEIVSFFKSIPRVNDPMVSDVRFEPLVKKLATHFRSMIHKSPFNRSLDDDSIETCGWILKAFRYMVESELHFTCDDIHDVDHLTTSESAELNSLRKIFNENGVINLCMDLIAVGIDHTIYIEAIKLLIALLYNGGGNIQLQQTIYRYLVATDSYQFFDLVKEMLENLKAWSAKENEHINYGHYPIEKSAIYKIPDDFIVLYLLQSFCEGSFIPIRDQIREQRGNSKLVNILDLLASYVGVLSRTENICNAYLATTVLTTILRLVQGPSKGNQDQFVLHTELLISLNRVIRDTRPKAQRSSNDLKDFQEKLKESIVDVLRGILEGHYETSLVYDRVSTTIDINVLHLLIFPQSESLLLNNNPKSLQEETQSVTQAKHSNILTGSQAKYLVLIKHMSKAIDEGFQGEERINSLKQNITSVEVVFEQQVHIVYFHIPDFIRDISMESKNKVIDIVNDNTTGSRELKLADFIQQCKKLYRESVHQQFLKRYGLAQLWAVKYGLSRFMFVNAFVINIILLLYYGTEFHGHYDYAQHAGHSSSKSYASTDITDDNHTGRRLAAASGSSSPNDVHDKLYIPELEAHVVLGLTAFQSFCALATVVIYAIVQIPVRYSTNMETIQQPFLAGFLSLLDPLILWYSGYFAVTVLAIKVNPLFVTVLLLDWIVLDNTSQDLLNAIFVPARQLLATLVMILITLNIFAFVVFVLYRHDVVTVPVHNIWEALKLSISYGFRGEYGVDHEMSPSTGLRMFLDVSFYFIVLSILRHIFFAIIVDTFGKLREEKVERETEAKNTCFICGIERHDYDRMLPAGIDFTFTDHRNLAHNPLYYLYFIMSIWHQARSEDTSIEIYVRKCITNGDVHWFPTGVLHEVPAVEEKRAELLELEDDKKGGGAGHHPTHQVTEAGGGGGHGSGGHGHGGGHGGGHDDAKHKKRQTSFMRKSLIFQPETQGNTSSGMEELIDKMTNMQKQIMKLSKDIYAGRERANSQPTYSLEMSTTSPAIFNTSLTASAHGSDPNTPSAMIRKQIPPPPITQPESDSYSSSGYSSTSDSEDDVDDTEGERKEEEKDAVNTENAAISAESIDRPSPLNIPALKNGGISPRRTNMSAHSIQSFIASTPKSTGASVATPLSKKLKREGTRNSQLTMGSGKKKKKHTLVPGKQLLEFNSDLKSKVERLDSTLQLIMKKLEEMETGNGRSGRPKSNPIEPEVSSNDTPKKKNIPGEDTNTYSELSDHSTRDPYPRFTESKKKARPQSAHPTTSSLQVETTSSGLENLDLSPIYSEKESKKNKQRPQSAHPYSSEIATQIKSPNNLNNNLNVSLSNPFMLQPHELINKIKKHKAKSHQKHKEKDSNGNNTGFSGPPKTLVTNLWVGNNSVDQLTEGYNSSLDK